MYVAPPPMVDDHRPQSDAAFSKGRLWQEIVELFQGKYMRWDDKR